MFTTGKCETYHSKTIHIHTHGQRWLETEGGKSQGPSNPIQMNNWFRNGRAWGSSWLKGLSALHALKEALSVCFLFFCPVVLFSVRSPFGRQHTERKALILLGIYKKYCCCPCRQRQNFTEQHILVCINNFSGVSVNIVVYKLCKSKNHCNLLWYSVVRFLGEHRKWLIHFFMNPAVLLTM